MSIGKRKATCLEPEPHDRSLNPRPSKLAKKRRTDDYPETLGKVLIARYNIIQTFILVVYEMVATIYFCTL